GRAAGDVGAAGEGAGRLAEGGGGRDVHDAGADRQLPGVIVVAGQGERAEAGLGDVAAQAVLANRAADRNGGEGGRDLDVGGGAGVRGGAGEGEAVGAAVAAATAEDGGVGGVSNGVGQGAAAAVGPKGGGGGVEEQTAGAQGGVAADGEGAAAERRGGDAGH